MLIFLFVKVVNTILYELGVQAQEFKVRYVYMEKAYNISRRIGKPMLVIGTPKGRHVCGDVLLDIAPRGECPFEVEGDIHNIPFEDNIFGSCVAAHVIEHIERPWQALLEMQRVADYVCVLYPCYASWFARIHPGHISLRWCWEELGASGVFEYGRYLDKLIRVSSCRC